METSQSITKISAAILKAQMGMGTAHKDAQNPYFKSKYADLNSIREACMPALNSNGISVLQPTVQIEGRNFVQTILLHESGEFISGLTEIVYNKPNDAQAQGSGITYARRYGLQSLMNVGAEDDDGNKASTPTNGATTAAPTNGNWVKSGGVTNGTPKKNPELLPGSPTWKKALDHLAKGGSISKVEESYFISPGNRQNLISEAASLA
jgi:hypothetical protein